MAMRRVLLRTSAVASCEKVLLGISAKTIREILHGLEALLRSGEIGLAEGMINAKGLRQLASLLSTEL
jgi:hypothetical protein